MLRLILVEPCAEGGDGTVLVVQKNPARGAIAFSHSMWTTLAGEATREVTRWPAQPLEKSGRPWRSR